MSRKIDLTGQKFNRLMVLEEAGRDKYKNVLWKCVCNCGKIRTVLGYQLRSGHSKSCGCYRIDKITKDGNWVKKRKKEYKKRYDRDVLARDVPQLIFSQLKSRAKIKSAAFEWDKEEFCIWYPAQPRFCHYCGRPIGRISSVGPTPTGISFDRIDPNGPYSEENCVLCCYKCNELKNNVWTYDEMKNILGPLLKQKWQSTISE